MRDPPPDVGSVAVSLRRGVLLPLGENRAHVVLGRRQVMPMSDVTISGLRPTRRLRLRGGTLDGQTLSVAIDVGGRVCCGPGPWLPSYVYVVTPQVITGPDGRVETIAVPATF